MVMKNKLRKHRIAKSTIIARKFSIAFASVFLLVAAVAIPTYISVQRSENISLQAESKPSVETKSVEEETVQESEENVTISDSE